MDDTILDAKKLNDFPIDSTTKASVKQMQAQAIVGTSVAPSRHQGLAKHP
jgi:hypothetical protein